MKVNKKTHLSKRILTFILALTMVFSNSVTSFAATIGFGTSSASGGNAKGESQGFIVAALPVVTITTKDNLYILDKDKSTGKELTIAGWQEGNLSFVYDTSKAIQFCPTDVYSYILGSISTSKLTATGSIKDKTDIDHCESSGNTELYYLDGWTRAAEGVTRDSSDETNKSYVKAPNISGKYGRSDGNSTGVYSTFNNYAGSTNGTEAAFQSIISNKKADRIDNHQGVYLPWNNKQDKTVSLDTLRSNNKAIKNLLGSYSKTSGSIAEYVESFGAFEYRVPQGIVSGSGVDVVYALAESLKNDSKKFNKVEAFHTDASELSDDYQEELALLVNEFNSAGGVGGIDNDSISEDNPLIVTVDYYMYVGYYSSNPTLNSGGITYYASSISDLFYNTMHQTKDLGSLKDVYVDLNATGLSDRIIRAFLYADCTYNNQKIYTSGVNLQENVGVDGGIDPWNATLKQRLNNTSGTTACSDFALGNTIAWVGDEPYRIVDARANINADSNTKVTKSDDWYYFSNATDTRFQNWKYTVVFATEPIGGGDHLAGETVVTVNGYAGDNKTDTTSSDISKTSELVKTDDIKDLTEATYSVFNASNTDDVWATGYSENTLASAIKDGYTYHSALSIGNSFDSGTSVKTVADEFASYTYKANYTKTDVTGGTTIEKSSTTNGKYDTASLNAGSVITLSGVTPQKNNTTIKAANSNNTTGLLCSYAQGYGIIYNKDSYTNLNLYYNADGSATTAAQQLKNAMQATMVLKEYIGGETDSKGTVKSQVTKGTKLQQSTSDTKASDYALIAGKSGETRRVANTALVYYNPEKVTSYSATINVKDPTYNTTAQKWYGNTEYSINSSLNYSIGSIGQFTLAKKAVAVVSIPLNKVTGKSIAETQAMTDTQLKAAINSYLSSKGGSLTGLELSTNNIVNTITSALKNGSSDNQVYADGISGGESFNVGTNYSTGDGGVCGYLLVTITTPDSITITTTPNTPYSVGTNGEYVSTSKDERIVLRSYQLNNVTTDLTYLATKFEKAITTLTKAYSIASDTNIDLNTTITTPNAKSNDNNITSAINIVSGTSSVSDCILGSHELQTGSYRTSYNITVAHSVDVAQSLGKDSHKKSDYYYVKGFTANNINYGGNFTYFNKINGGSVKFDTINTSFANSTTWAASNTTDNDKVGVQTYAIETKRVEFGDNLVISNLSDISATDNSKAVGDLTKNGDYSDVPKVGNLSGIGTVKYNKVYLLDTKFTSSLIWQTENNAYETDIGGTKSNSYRTLLSNANSCLQATSNSNVYNYLGNHILPVSNADINKASVNTSNKSNTVVTYNYTFAGATPVGVGNYNAIALHYPLVKYHYYTTASFTNNVMYFATNVKVNGQAIDNNLNLYIKGTGTTTASKATSYFDSDSTFTRTISNISGVKTIQPWGNLTTVGTLYNTLITAKKITETGNTNTVLAKVYKSASEGITRGLHFKGTQLDYNQIELKFIQVCEKYIPSAQKDIASADGSDSIILNTLNSKTNTINTALIYKDKIIGDRDYENAKDETDKTKYVSMKYYPEVKMQYFNITSSDASISSASDVTSNIVKVVGEQLRQSYSDGLYIYAINQGLKTDTSSVRSSDSDSNSLNKVSTDDAVTGVTISSGYQVSTDKSSSNPIVYAGSDVTVNVDSNFTINLYGYSLDIIDKSVDGKNDEASYVDADGNTIAAKKYGIITASDTILNGSLSENVSSTVKNTSYTKYNGIITGANPYIYKDWNNAGIVNGSDTGTHNAELLKADFAAWAKTMLDVKNYQADVVLTVEGTSKATKTYENFNTTIGKLVAVKNGKATTQSFSAANNVYDDGVYSINIENGDVVRTYSKDGKDYYDQKYLALIQQIAEDANISVKDADKYFMESDLHTTILNAIQSANDSDNKSGKTVGTMLSTNTLGDDNNWYDEKVKSVVVRRYKTDSFTITGTVLQDKIDYNVTGAGDTTKYTGKWGLSLSLVNLDKTGIATANNLTDQAGYSTDTAGTKKLRLFSDLHITNADFDIRNSSVDAGN
jgi:hypothetical protein